MRRSMDVDANVCVAVTLAVATMFTVARFWARYMTKVKLWLDDWFALAAYITAIGYSVLIIAWTILGGLGQEMATLSISPAEAVMRSSIFVLLVELFYAFSLFCSKIAILGMYWRLFSTSPIRLPIQVLAAMSLVWVIIRTFMTIFHCVPPQAFWDPPVKNARCDIDNSKFFFGTTLTHLLIDVAILMLPAIQVRQLKLRTGQKLGVIGLFMFGAVILSSPFLLDTSGPPADRHVSVCVAAIVLLISAASLDSHSPEMPYDMINIMIPATVEVNFAVVSACLPTIRPVIQRLLPNSGLTSGGQSSTNGGGGVRTGTGVKLRTLATAIELEDDSSTKNFADRNYSSGLRYADAETGSSGSNEDAPRPGPRTVIEAGADDGQSRSGQPEDGGIRVKNEMSISYEAR
ncbi:uncharacterized protein F5Z01DRAFT_638720 [Emericellopsis atlantica]|uniref:Rhodopsin domain-containing protein n=1 Tax=Emericellopsis atlantica TaxID=2614577 RepID=A0A9P7ZH69_9HYPO|nr:uncharacterized protein F5Z01DRAFT_638720 [Emericellopsis atlantica]KAG9252083.1 hypothetical protein F5Z01DRAFT_638720 [Emericellopsis atlantica]